MPLELAAIHFPSLIMFLLWGVWVLLNLWLWQSSKSTGNLLMMVGAGLLALVFLLAFFGAMLGEGGFWIAFFGLVALTVGFYLSVQPMVMARINALRSKVSSATAPPANPPK